MTAAVVGLGAFSLGTCFGALLMSWMIAAGRADDRMEARRE